MNEPTDTELNLLLRASLTLCKPGTRAVNTQVPAEYHLARGAIRWIGERYGIVQMCPETRYRVVERTSETTYRILGDWHTDSAWLAIYRADAMEQESKTLARQKLGALGWERFAKEKA